MPTTTTLSARDQWALFRARALITVTDIQTGVTAFQRHEDTGLQLKSKKQDPTLKLKFGHTTSLIPREASEAEREQR